MEQWRRRSTPGKENKGEELREQIGGCLKRLEVDCVELLYLHAPDHNTEIEETLKVQRHTAQGKFKKLGLSNYTAWQVARCMELSEVGWVAPPCQGRPQRPHASGEELFPCQFYGIVTRTEPGRACHRQVPVRSGKGEEHLLKSDQRAEDGQLSPAIWKKEHMPNRGSKGSVVSERRCKLRGGCAGGSLPLDQQHGQERETALIERQQVWSSIADEHGAAPRKPSLDEAARSSLSWTQTKQF